MARLLKSLIFSSDRLTLDCQLCFDPLPLSGWRCCSLKWQDWLLLTLSHSGSVLLLRPSLPQAWIIYYGWRTRKSSCRMPYLSITLFASSKDCSLTRSDCLSLSKYSKFSSFCTRVYSRLSSLFQCCLFSHLCFSDCCQLLWKDSSLSFCDYY